MAKKKKRAPLPQLPQNIHLVDTHCHLDMLGGSEEVADIIQRAQTASVSSIITIGIDLQSSQKAVQFADIYSNVYASVGIHPHHAADVSDAVLQELKSLCLHEKVVAFGEIGIDTVKNYAPLAVQQKAFVQQLGLAKELDLPVIIHDREAHDDIYTLLTDSGPFPAGGVIHCYSGDGDMARKFIELGFYISIPGVVTFKKADMLQDAVRAVPLESLLVETDAPFLAPDPYRGKRNEPVYTLYTAQKVAELKGISLAEVAKATTMNTEKLFNITVAA